jgi:two-component system sensor histidine kinase YesM
MIEALSEQIHYIIGKVDDLVLLKDEINIIEKYIFLLNCRIKGELKLDIDFEVPTDLWIPKLLLQPIVENSYIHGIKPKNGSGRINISVEVSDENVEIYVMDNGLGMTQDEINQINQLLESAEMGIKNEVSWQSIGLKNVYDRIKYLFGEEYGIEVTSTKNTGTLVKIILPKIVKE